jgi:hypothetical protein
VDLLAGRYTWEWYRAGPFAERRLALSGVCGVKKQNGMGELLTIRSAAQSSWPAKTRIAFELPKPRRWVRLPGRTMARTRLRMMLTFPSSPYHSGQRIFSSPAGRPAYQTEPARRLRVLRIVRFASVAAYNVLSRF